MSHAPLVSLALVLGAMGAPRTAFADDDGHRFGLTPLLGGGLAAVVHPGPLPAPIAFTDLGAEILGEFRPWAGFLRVEYLSSGDDGRWTTWTFSAGAEYRLFGTSRSTSAFLRGGVAYERWTGNDAGCPIALVVPSSCNLEGAAASSFDVNSDMIGLVGGARVEMPIPWMYLAFGADVVPAVAVDTSAPSAAFSLRVTLALGFRDIRHGDDQVKVRGRTPGRRHQYDVPPSSTETTTPASGTGQH